MNDQSWDKKVKATNILEIEGVYLQLFYYTIEIYIKQETHIFFTMRLFILIQGEQK
jgi:hypothetical protein